METTEKTSAIDWAIDVLQTIKKNILAKSVTTKKNWNEIASYADACANTGTTPRTRESFGDDDEGELDWNRHQLSVIAKAIHDGDVIDWNNGSQKKYRIWFEWNSGSSSFGFCYSNFYWSISFSGVGSRLHFLSEEKANYFGKTFIELHNKILKHQ